MPAGRYVRTALLEWITGTTMPSPPAEVWAHLATSAPGAETPGGTPTTDGYAPVELTSWAAISEGADADTLNPGGTVTFGPFAETAGSDATHLMIMDGDDPGTANMLAYAALGTARPFVNAAVIEIAAADLDLRA